MDLPGDQRRVLRLNGLLPGQDYDAYVKQMLMSLKVMRKTRLR